MMATCFILRGSRNMKRLESRGENEDVQDVRKTVAILVFQCALTLCRARCLRFQI